MPRHRLRNRFFDPRPFRRLRERVEALELESGSLSGDEEIEEDAEGETEVRAGVPDR